jgi:hypothetical protein
LQRTVVWRGTTVASSVQCLHWCLFSSFSPRMRWCRVMLDVLFACVVSIRTTNVLHLL